jgi:outer membrane receptor protein involved in Fe transport
MRTGLFLAALVAGAIPLRAEEDVFLTLTRRAEPAALLPTNVTTITREELRRSGARTLDQALVSAPSARVTVTGGAGSFATVRLRGVPSSSQVQVLVDDQPLGGVATQFVDLSQIAVDDVERIEIVRGGASVLYGANTIGGVVNVITRRHREAGPRSFVGAEMGSFLTRRTRAGIGGGNGKWNGRVSGGRDLSQGFQSNGALDRVFLTANGGRDLGGGASVTVDASYTENQVGDPQGTSVPFDQWNGRRERQAVNATAGVEQFTSLGRVKARTPLGGDRVLESQFYGSAQNYRYFLDTSLPASFTVDNGIFGNDTRLMWGERVLTGFSYERDGRRADGRVTGHVVTAGAYAQYTLGGEAWTASPAVRYDHNKNFGVAWNPRLTAAARAGGWKGSLNAARSFHAPTLSQLFENFPAFPPFAGPFEGNPDLRPEIAWTYDVGVERDMGKSGTLRATGFYTRLTNRIYGATDPFPAANRNLNGPRAEISGVEGELRAAGGPLSFEGSYVYTRALGNTSFRSRFDVLPYSPKHAVLGRWTWTGPRAWAASVAGRYASRQFADPGETGTKVPSYTVWGARIAKTILSGEVFLAGDNLFNRRYAETSTFGNLNPQAGRTISGGVTVRFEN